MRTAVYDDLSISTQSEEEDHVEAGGAEDSKASNETTVDECPTELHSAQSPGSKGAQVQDDSLFVDSDGFAPRDASKTKPDRAYASTPEDPFVPLQHHLYTKTHQEAENEDTIVDAKHRAQSTTHNNGDGSVTPLTSSKRNSVNEEDPSLCSGGDESNDDADDAQQGSQIWFDDGSSSSDNDDDHDEENGSEPSISTWSRTSHFTEINRIDLEKQAEGQWNYQDGDLYYMGSIWDLRSRRHQCDLCRHVWRRTRRNQDIKTRLLAKSRCILKLIEFKGRKFDATRDEMSMFNIAYIYGYEVDNPRFGEWITISPYVFQGTHRDLIDSDGQMLSSQNNRFDNMLWGEARWRHDVCDYNLLSEWLDKCEKEHNHPQPKGIDGLALRLIDVEHRCLVEQDGWQAEPPRFVALSYMWGMAQQKIMLTKERLIEFRIPGFFNQPLDHSIQDAFDLVLGVGEKYL